MSKLRQHATSQSEGKAGSPKRQVANPGHDAELKKHTVTNLYNARLAYKKLDSSVVAYSWARR